MKSPQFFILTFLYAFQSTFQICFFTSCRLLPSQSAVALLFHLLLICPEQETQEEIIFLSLFLSFHLIPLSLFTTFLVSFWFFGNILPVSCKVSVNKCLINNYDLQCECGIKTKAVIPTQPNPPKLVYLLSRSLNALLNAGRSSKRADAGIKRCESDVNSEKTENTNFPSLVRI